MFDDAPTYLLLWLTCDVVEEALEGYTEDPELLALCLGSVAALRQAIFDEGPPLHYDYAEPIARALDDRRHVLDQPLRICLRAMFRACLMLHDKAVEANHLALSSLRFKLGSTAGQAWFDRRLSELQEVWIVHGCHAPTQLVDP